MNVFTIPLRYTKVKFLRTAMLTAVFALGIASMTGLWQVSALIGESFERQLVSYGANILVTPKREILKVAYGGYTLGDVTLEEHWISMSEAHKGIDAMPLRANVAVVAPKLLTAARIADRTVALVGVDWSEELTLKGYWEVNGSFPSQDADNELLAGASLAESLQLQPGQALAIGERTFTVSGLLLPTGSDDDAALFAPLSFVQTHTGRTDQAAFLEVAALCSGCPIEDIVDQLQTAIPGSDVRALRQVAESRMYAVHFAQKLTFSVSLVILVTACAMIIISMLSAVAERRKEIGIMRAVGFSRSSVFSVFIIEAVGIGLASGVIGYLTGHVLADYVLGELHLAEMATVPFVGESFGVVVAAAAITAGLAAAFPAWKATLVEPAEALTAF